MVTKFRGSWLWFHRWMGIALGVVIALIGITGAVLIFEKPIDVALNPGLFRVAPEGQIKSFDEIAAAALAAHPNHSTRYLQRLSDDPRDSVMVVIRDEAGVETHVFVNPYTGAILGERSQFTAMSLIRRLHGDLAMGEFGRNFVGVLGVLCVVFFVAGAVLWWPAKGGVKRALTIKTSSDTPRLMREVHNVFGAYFVIFFVLAALTVPPIVWKFSSPAGDGAGGGPPPGAARPTGVGGPPPVDAAPRQPITWQQAAEIGKSQFPDQYVGFELASDGARGIYMVRLWPPGKTGTVNMTNVFVDKYSGRVLRSQSPQRITAASLLQSDFAASVHSGAFFGATGRWIMFAAGLGLPVLFFTGLVMWWMKRRKQERE